jgi:hypothetical protein
MWSLLLGIEMGKTQRGMRMVVADQQAGLDFEATGLVSTRDGYAVKFGVLVGHKSVWLRLAN